MLASFTIAYFFSKKQWCILWLIPCPDFFWSGRLEVGLVLHHTDFSDRTCLHLNLSVMTAVDLIAKTNRDLHFPLALIFILNTQHSACDVFYVLCKIMPRGNLYIIFSCFSLQFIVIQTKWNVGFWPLNVFHSKNVNTTASNWVSSCTSITSPKNEMPCFTAIQWTFLNLKFVSTEDYTYVFLTYAKQLHNDIPLN